MNQDAPRQFRMQVEACITSVLINQAFEGRTRITADMVRACVARQYGLKLHVTVVNAIMLDSTLVRPTGVQYEYVANV